MYTLDVGKRAEVGSGLGLFLSVGHWPNIRPQKGQTKYYRAQYQNYETLFY
jgi:hypothetical protein